MSRPSSHPSKPPASRPPSEAALLATLPGAGPVAFAPFVASPGTPADDGAAFLAHAPPSLDATEAPPLPSGPPLDEGPDHRVMDFLAVLQEYQLQCEQAGNYEEAARCSDQLVLLRAQEEGRRVQALKARHVAERASVATAQAQQFRDFNAQWDRYLSEYDAMATLYAQQMQEKHLAKLRAQQEALHTELVKKPVKFGREVLEWRSREAVLVKHHKYSEAARIKAVVEELERRERARIDEERLVVFSQREANFRAHQRAELEALLKRVETRRAGALRGLCARLKSPHPSPLRARAHARTAHTFSPPPPLPTRARRARQAARLGLGAPAAAQQERDGGAGGAAGGRGAGARKRHPPELCGHPAAGQRRNKVAHQHGAREGKGELLWRRAQPRGHCKGEDGAEEERRRRRGPSVSERPGLAAPPLQLLFFGSRFSPNHTQ